MKKFTMFFILIAFQLNAQNQKKIKEDNIISSNDSSFNKIKFISNNIIEKKTDIVYMSNGDILSFKKTEIIDFNNGNLFNFSELELKSFRADLHVLENKIIISPWLFRSSNKGEINDKRNVFFNKNTLFIAVEDRKNYSFKNRSYQFGVISIPVKWYVDSKLGNVATDLNAMFNVGYNWGKKKFVKLPNEEKIREYNSNWSFNYLLGLSKVSLDDSNIKIAGSVKGNIAAVSTGLAFGYHYSKFSFMIVSGIDIPTSNHNDWKFSNKPWVGLGIGFDVLKL